MGDVCNVKCQMFKSLFVTVDRLIFEFYGSCLSTFEDNALEIHCYTFIVASSLTSNELLILPTDTFHTEYIKQPVETLKNC